MNAPSMRSYAEYASVYDAIGQADAGLQALQQALTLVAGHSGRALDLGCGTGVAAIWLARQGWQVRAVDHSVEMLRIAEGRTRDAHVELEFVAGDLRELSIGSRDSGQPDGSAIEPGAFALVTCLGDTLSELTGAGDLRALCQLAAGALSANGLLIFDCRTEAEYATWDARDMVLYDDGGLLVYAQQAYNARTHLASNRLAWFSRAEERWWRTEEIHTLRCWLSDEIHAALVESGFTQITMLTNTGRIADPDQQRVIYLAQR